jgi:pseudouridine-5'-phosphate glycosidase
VLVACAGAKSILHLPRPLELLETLGVPVVGYRTDAIPAFYVRDHTSPATAGVGAGRVGVGSGEAVRRARAHGRGRGWFSLSVPTEVALPAAEFDAWVAEAEADAGRAGVTGAKVTPFLLARIAELSGGRALAANRALIVANARLAVEVAAAYNSA